MSELLKDYNGYIFAALWFLIAVYLCYQGHKTHKLFYLMSVLFFFMGGWYMINEFVAVNLFSSPYIWIFRGICVLFLIIIGIFIFKNRQQIISQADEKDENSKT